MLGYVGTNGTNDIRLWSKMSAHSTLNHAIANLKNDEKTITTSSTAIDHHFIIIIIVIIRIIRIIILFSEVAISDDRPMEMGMRAREVRFGFDRRSVISRKFRRYA